MTRNFRLSTLSTLVLIVVALLSLGMAAQATPTASNVLESVTIDSPSSGIDTIHYSFDYAGATPGDGVYGQVSATLTYYDSSGFVIGTAPATTFGASSTFTNGTGAYSTSPDPTFACHTYAVNNWNSAWGTYTTACYQYAVHYTTTVYDANHNILGQKTIPGQFHLSCD